MTASANWSTIIFRFATCRMPGCRCISSRPTSSRATASCCRKVRPRKRSWRAPRFPAHSRRSATGTTTSPIGAISSNTPIRVAVKQGATRLIILPTGHACANQTPPVGAVANALHALTLVDRAAIGQRAGKPRAPAIEHFVVPPLCPLVGSPLRLLAHVRSYRARDPDHRCLAGAKRAGAGRDPRTKCGRTLTEAAPARPGCNANNAPAGGGGTLRRPVSPMNPRRYDVISYIVYSASWIRLRRRAWSGKSGPEFSEGIMLEQD